MTSIPQSQPSSRPVLPWLTVALAGVLAPAIAMLMLADASSRPFVAGASILAVGMMGTGMIAAAAAGRFWVGIVLALLSGAGLILLAQVLGMPTLLHLPATALALVIASISFSARGALFARSALDKGWWIAVFVVAGEAAMLFTAAAMPGALPGWLLALLPAQWASAAIRTAIAGGGPLAAGAELVALAGTAAATLLVAALWPRRWTYLIMFSAWIGLSALVYNQAA